jgi:Histidine kinase-, DNA gyrase B-, and HSP90-like ATPase
MAQDQIIRLDLQEDFAEKLSASRPVQALAELIWNGLDAEATVIKITAEADELRLRSITVHDNGHGMAPSEAGRFFGFLGGSWKKANNVSKNGNRHLHGKEGRGRLRALALGRVAEWTVTGADDSGVLSTFTVTIVRDDVRQARISHPVQSSVGDRTGVRVRITELDKDWRLDAPGVSQELSELFALYMTEYPDVSMSVDGNKIDPAVAILRKRTYSLPAIESGVESFEATLEVIEWKRPTDRMLYLCDEGGLPLYRIPPTIQAPGFEFSAYLKSPYNSILNQQGTLEVAELDSSLAKAIEDSKEQLRQHFKARQAEDTRSLVDRWKEEAVYPYEGDPGSPVQTAERQVFDIVALNVATAIPNFDLQDKLNKKFQLRMLKQAVEKSPEEVQLIMNEVLGLPKQKQEELAKLLKRTTLSAVISAAKTVADRLEVLTGLEALLFDLDLKKHFKERSQLHKILEENTWIFGEQFALTLSDKSLTEVLARVIERRNTKRTRKSVEVKRADGRRGIIDLFLSRSVPMPRPEEREYLIVELKAPSIKISSAETSQVRSYAYAIQEDERFRGIKARWEFWVISTDMDAHAKQEITSSDRPYGLLDRKADCQIWIKTWSELLNEGRARLQIFEKELNYNADRDESLTFLRTTYAKILAAGNTDGPAVRGGE